MAGVQPQQADTVAAGSALSSLLPARRTLWAPEVGVVRLSNA